jgi:hypothetical protein
LTMVLKHILICNFGQRKVLLTKPQGIEWDGTTNPLKWIQNHSNYYFLLKPESTTRLYIQLNFKFYSMTENLESHILNPNNVSGAVQILNTNVHILQTENNQGKPKEDQHSQ